MATATETKTLSPARQYRQLATSIAQSLLSDWVGPDRAKEAAGRISAALSAAAASARNPNDFYECTPDSIGRCVAIAALTEIMPGTGATALAYLIPRRPRKGERPQLQYQLSHRGLNALARRTGQTMIAIPISQRDELTFNADGDVQVVNRDIDNPPISEEDLRGVIVLIRETSNGSTICRGWVPVSVINARRETSDSYKFAKNCSPWQQWYIEMALKTAMHYAVSRGWCVIDDAAAVRAISIDQSQDYAQIAPPVTRSIEGNRSDDLAQRLAERHEQELSDDLERIPPDAGEEPHEAPENLGEESQEPPEATEPGPIAMGFISRFNEAKNRKELETAWNDAQQSKLGGRMTEEDYAAVKSEREACYKSLKK